MDQHSASEEHDQEQATPIFSAYRRGYDPEQVDRYVADQQRRLDEMTARASEAERRLAAAVGQLRELHRRVAVLESEDRAPQTPALDTLGERVQRILQEAWEGAYALRQGAEQEVGDLRAQAAAEAEEIVETARSKARALDEATERRRQAFLERMEEDRSRALAQIAYLHDQRRVALEELVKVKVVIEDTVAGARFPATDVGEAPGGPAAGPSRGPVEDDDEVAELLAEIGHEPYRGGPWPGEDREEGPIAHGIEATGPGEVEVQARRSGDRSAPSDPAPSRPAVAGSEVGDRGGEVEPRVDPRPTMAVEHLGTRDVRRGRSAGVFDFEAEQPTPE